MRPLITLTTDFGTSSPYVAQMKAAILVRQREVDIIDITHAIHPQQVIEGALVLDDVTRRFPDGTLHVVVVDPGVGTSRRLVYAEIGTQRYLAPDNGLLSPLARRTSPTRLIELGNPQYWASKVSHTFHGRDILAPVAGHLAAGLPPEQLGPALDSLVELQIPEPHMAADHIVGHVLFCDSFGNAITNIRREQMERLGPSEQISVACKSWSIYGVSRTYGDHRPGDCIALFDSQGRLELAVVHGSAEQMIGCECGTSVVVRRQ